MNTHKMFAPILILAAVTALGSAATAQKMASRSKLSFDQTFVTKAAQAGIAEVDEGKTAVTKSENQSVKDFGQKMIDDHTKANDELKSLAHGKNINLPEEPNSAQKAALSRLSRLSGGAFDKTYIGGARTDHLQAIKLFEEEIKRGTDPELKAFATKTLPTIREHYKMLMEMKLGSKMSSSKM